MPIRIDIPRRVLVRVEVPVQAGGVVNVAEEGVLGEEASQLRIEVAGFGEVEAGLSIEEVAGEAEAVSGGVELCWEAVVAPNRWVRCDSVAPESLKLDAMLVLAALRHAR